MLIRFSNQFHCNSPHLLIKVPIAHFHPLGIIRASIGTWVKLDIRVIEQCKVVVRLGIGRKSIKGSKRKSIKGSKRLEFEK